MQTAKTKRLHHSGSAPQNDSRVGRKKRRTVGDDGGEGGSSAEPNWAALYVEANDARVQTMEDLMQATSTISALAAEKRELELELDRALEENASSAPGSDQCANQMDGRSTVGDDSGEGSSFVEPDWDALSEEAKNALVQTSDTPQPHHLSTPLHTWTDEEILALYPLYQTPSARLFFKVNPWLKSVTFPWANVNDVSPHTQKCGVFFRMAGWCRSNATVTQRQSGSSLRTAQ